MATAKKTTSPKKKTAAKSSSKPSQGGGKSATAKTGGAKKSTSSKSSSASKTGASKSAGTAKKAASKSSTAKSSTAAKRGGSKTSTANKSGAAGKRTASGGAKASGRSTTAKKTAAKSTTKSAVNRSTTTKQTTATAKAKNPAAKKTAAKAAPKKTAKRAASKSTTATLARKGRGKGAISRIADTVTSLFSEAKPNAIDLLKADHKIVEGFFEQVKANEDGNNRDLFKNIKFELDAHAHIEETIFYPYLLEKGDEELQRIVREGIEEHRQAKMFLAELNALDGDHDRFKAKLKVLIEDVEHHVKEEENEMFKMVEDQIEAEKIESMGLQMEKEKARFQQGMTPPPKLTGKAAGAAK